jgi:hypothetical protein
MEEQTEVPYGDEVDQIEGFATKVSAENINFVSGFALGASAQQDMTMSKSLAFGTAVGRDMTVSDSLSITTAVGRDFGLKDGLAGILTVGGNTQIEEGGSLLTVSREVTSRNGFLGLVISQQVNLEEGSKVLLSTKQAAAFGAAFGVTFALLRLLLRRK